MTAAPTRARIERRYRIPDTHLPDVIGGLRKLSTLLFGEEARFHGTLRLQSKPDVKLAFEDLTAFCARLGERVISLRAEFGAPWPDTSNASLWLHEGRSALDLAIDVDDTRLQEAQAALAELEAKVGIAPLPQTPHTGDGATAQLERRYYCREAQVERWLELLEGELLPLVTPAEFRARLKASDPDAPELEYGDPARLRAELPAHPARVRLEVRMTEQPFSHVGLDFDAGYQPALGVQARFVPSDLERVRAAMARVEAGLDLQRAPDAPGESSGRSGPLVTCFTEGQLDPTWFERACAEIEQLEPWPRWFVGHLRERADGSQAMRYDSLERWKAAALKQWPRLLELYADLEGTAYSFFVHLEPKLDFVRLRVGARDEAEAEATLGQLLERLALEPQAVEPYATSRTVREFRFNPWDRAAYAEAVRAVVRQFVAREPVLLRRDTYVGESDGHGGEIRVHYEDLGAFVDRLKSDKPYVGASLSAKGPKGQALLLEVLDNCSRLSVRSTLEPGRFADLVGALKGQLSLAAPVAPALVPQRGFWGRFWRAEGMPGHAFTGLLGALISAGGFLAVNAIPRNDIQLIRPFARSGEPAAVTAGCVEVSWVVVQNHWPELGKRLEGELGDVHLGPAGGGRLPPVLSHPSGAEIHVSPGRWTLYVSDRARGATGPVIEVVADEADYQERREELVRRCGPAPESRG